jgi:DNA-directed RNA polymerase II subunit RPB1
MNDNNEEVIINEDATLVLEGIELQLYTDEETRNLAVVQVLNPSTYDRGLPKANGVNDPRMGVTDKHLECPTCGLTSTCNNHYGYIELEKPVLRLGHVASALCLLRSFCWACSKPKFYTGNVSDYPSQTIDNFVDIRAILAKTASASKERLRSVSEICKNKFKCPWNDCGCPQPIYLRVNKVFISKNFRAKEKAAFLCPEEMIFASSSKRILPDEILRILKFIPNIFLEILGYKPDKSHPQNYVFQAQLVPPPSIRPANIASSTDARMRCENDLTSAIQDVVRANNELSACIKNGNDEYKIQEAWDRLQIFVAAIINQNSKKLSTFSGAPAVHARAMTKRKTKVIKDRLTGKRGRLRGNLSGKRVDHAGRTVVGPDAIKDIFELGVPGSIMKILTFPERVNNLNKKDLGERILLGANVLGGALTVRRNGTNGQEDIIYLSLLDINDRLALSESLKNGWTVERHLKDGDWVLFNRQPSLHKASIMAFKAYTVSGLQFKLPLPCTKPFNADFDGDEMNIHSLQDYGALAEAQELMAVPHQMVTPQNNSVIIALVQDALVSAYLMSKRSSMCTKERAIQLACSIHYSCNDLKLYGQIPDDKTKIGFLDCIDNLPAPAILKGLDKHGNVTAPSWTGKQIMGWMLPSNFNFVKNNSDVEDIWKDNAIIIKNGEIMCGRLCKKSLGNSSGSIVHEIWKMYGPWAAAKFVSDAQRILMDWLRVDTLCISINDCLTNCDDKVKSITTDAIFKANELNLLDVPPAIKEVKQTQILQETLRLVGATVLESMDNEKSGIGTVIESGAKGNLMNIAQIAGIVGQQTINGLRISFRKGPLGYRTLANFSPNDNSPEARGFVGSSYLTGLTPSEFFFHQQAGREGVVATAVSTADTGYNQRRMVKNQESEVIGYDFSVRASSNFIVQLHYGFDDYDGSMVEKIKVPMQLEKHMICKITPENEILWLNKCTKLFDDRKKSGIPFGTESTFESISMPVNFSRIIKSLNIGKPLNNVSCEQHMIIENCHTVLREILLGVLNFHGSWKHIHNVESIHIQDLIFFENRDWRVEDDPSFWTRVCIATQCTTSVFLNENIFEKNDCNKIVKAFLRMYQKGIINPGEGVGAVGSSSIGEPSTQMTLNTFHYSGIAEKNVTITGLPRFKQIINAVDTYETSNMKISMIDNSQNIKKFSSSLVKTRLSSIVKKSKVINIYEYSDLIEAEKILAKSLHVLSSGLEFTMNASTKESKKQKGNISALSEDLHDVKKNRPTFVAVFELDKTELINRQIHLDNTIDAISEYVGCNGAVVSSFTWENEWIVMAQADKENNCIAMENSSEKLMAEIFHDALLENVTLNGIDYLKKAVAIFDKNTDKWFVETEGSNFLEVLKLPGVDPLNTSTNNIQEVACNLGLEAAVCLMQAELHRVLSFDGSYVDPRHTWLLADTVARSGCINPLNRHKMEELGGSLLQCASFEQTLEVFDQGAAFAKNDMLGGATEKLIVGQPVNVGTGSFAIINEQNILFGEDEEECAPSFVAPMDLYLEENDLQQQQNTFVESIYGNRGVSLKRPPQTTCIPICDIPEKEAVQYLSALGEKIAPVIALMRQQAQSRIPILVKSALVNNNNEINKLQFDQIDELLQSYSGWSLMPKGGNFVQFVDVEYNVDDTLILTRVDYSNNLILTKHVSKTILLENQCSIDKHWNIKSSAILTKSFEGEDLPPFVQPKHIKILQEKHYQKGAWLFRICRTWEGANIIDAEASQRNGSRTCKYEIYLEILKPWNLLELRGSSDVAIACGIIQRLSMLIENLI